MEKQLVIKRGLEDILKKSSELMSEKGCNATGMRDLAKATNLSLAGLYHYFSSKQELIFTINDRGFSSLLALAQAIEVGPDQNDNRLYRAIESHIQFFCRHRSDMKIMMFGAHEMEKEHAQKIRRLKETYRKLFSKLVCDYIEKNSKVRPTPTELKRKTFLLFGMMNWTFGWYSPRKHGTENELIDDIFNTFTKGVLSEGRKNGVTKRRR